MLTLFLIFLICSTVMLSMWMGRRHDEMKGYKDWKESYGSFRWCNDSFTKTF